MRLEAGPSGFRSSFDLVMPAGVRSVSLQLGGLHNVRNALGAAAAAAAAGASFDNIASGLAQVRAVPGRLDLRPARQGAALVDDSYNANPTSLRAGLETFSSLPGRHWLVLGEMRELGAGADELHAEIGRYARASRHRAPVRRRRGAQRHCCGCVWQRRRVVCGHRCADRRRHAGSSSLGVTVLIKGSRSNRLERVAAALAAEPAATGTKDTRRIRMLLYLTK